MKRSRAALMGGGNGKGGGETLKFKGKKAYGRMDSQMRGLGSVL